MRQDILESTVLLDVLPVWETGLSSFRTHDARLSINMCPVQGLGPAVDESYEFASSLRPLMEYTEGDNVNLRGICDFLSSSDPNVQCIALQLLEHAAEWENTKFTECMSETFGPVAQLVLDARDIQVHCATLDTLRLFLASPRATDIVKSMIPHGVVDVVSADLSSAEPLVQLASVELLDAASQSEEILVKFVAAVSLISRLLPSMLPTTQVIALRVLEFSAGSSTHELVKVVADTFHYLTQPLTSPETAVQIAALKVLEVGVGTKNRELARAVKTILPVLMKILSSGETDVQTAVRKVLKVGAQLFDAETISSTLLPESSLADATTTKIPKTMSTPTPRSSLRITPPIQQDSFSSLTTLHSSAVTSSLSPSRPLIVDTGSQHEPPLPSGSVGHVSQPQAEGTTKPMRSSSASNAITLHPTTTTSSLSVAHPFNVLIFGETGVGKSSVINLIAGRDVAQTSPDGPTCTLDHAFYEIILDNHRFKLCEVSSIAPMNYFRRLFTKWRLKRSYKKLYKDDGVFLLLYCMRNSRAQRALVRDYKFFTSIIGSTTGHVPVAAVVTHLEDYPSAMDDWWQRNEQNLRRQGMQFSHHVCITSLPDDQDASPALRTRRRLSEQAIRSLICDVYLPSR